MCHFLLCVFIVCLAVHEGMCVRCFVCNSMDEPRCLDPQNEGLNATFCNSKTIPQDARGFLGMNSYADLSLLKYACLTYNVRVGDSNKTTINRVCTLGKRRNFDPCTLYKDWTSMARKTLFTENWIDYCEMCTTDYCNSSPKSIYLNFNILYLPLVSAIIWSVW